MVDFSSSDSVLVVGTLFEELSSTFSSVVDSVSLADESVSFPSVSISVDVSSRILSVEEMSNLGIKGYHRYPLV